MSHKLKVVEHSKPWYAKGLSFQCTECGKCCTGAPGYIWVNAKEIEAMANHLNLSIQEFSDQYLRLAQGRLSLKEHPKTYDCVFLKDNKCQLYALRPTQCRTFPWWPHLLKSKEDWLEAAKYCEGINIHAPVVPLETIEEQKELQEKSMDNS